LAQAPTELYTLSLHDALPILAMGVAVTLFALAAVDWDLSGVPAERWTLVGDSDSDIPWHTLLTGMVFIHIFYWGTNMVIAQRALDRKSTRLNSSHVKISYAVF